MILFLKGNFVSFFFLVGVIELSAHISINNMANLIEWIHQ